jgi:hypothetical protein
MAVDKRKDCFSEDGSGGGAGIGHQDQSHMTVPGSLAWRQQRLLLEREGNCWLTADCRKGLLSCVQRSAPWGQQSCNAGHSRTSYCLGLLPRLGSGAPWQLWQLSLFMFSYQEQQAPW